MPTVKPGPRILAHVSRGGRPEPWERFEREPDAEYRYFVHFRDMPYQPGADQTATRKLAKVAAELGVSDSYMAALASAFRWHARVTAFDQHIDRMKQDAIVTRVEQDTVRWWRTFNMARELGERTLAKFLQRCNDDPDMPVATVKDVISLLEVAHKGMRLISGSATERVETTESLDMSRLSADELRQLAAIRKKASVVDTTVEPEPERDK